ncbi:Oidioi.mRNA.OKI2018_I69.PAR.g9539.t1.cds [Oikopleura dioica]|uniref:Oidioi.mRNA.OKI2018_I69.PAR.g9539.t1.cds n=1 Tax=Oikopleura dioica TaxID=34765 RepID=A0ABN7RTV0_OIKDI|nr:Oidioi.mRNA.OKI2018_I69.PAR.g9539.t1.cds [Oikopleura dioica]
MTVIKRQNTFPPSICVVSRVKFSTLFVGENEEMGIEVEEFFESEIEEAKNTPAILLKSVEKYSPAYRANLRAGDQLTHIGGLTVNTVDLVPYMLRQHSKGGTLILGYLPATRPDYRRSSLPKNLGDLSQNGILHLLSEGRDSRSTIKLAKEILAMIEKYRKNQDHVELLTKVNPKLATHPKRRELENKYQSVIDVPYQTEDGLRLAFQVAQAYREENHEKIQLYGQELCEVLSNYPDLYDLIWDEISYLMGREAAADIQGFYPNKIEIILKKEEAAEPEKIPLTLKTLHYPLKVNEMVDLFNRSPEREIIDAVLIADESTTKADLEILWKLVNNNEILETLTCRTSKAFRVRIERFRKYLQKFPLLKKKSS